MALISVLASCNKPSPSQPIADESHPFPQEGNYHVVHEATQGGESKSEEYEVTLDVSDEVKFAGQLAKDEGTHCRDKQMAIRKGSFEMRMTCDAPDGDIHNIEISRQGTYTKDSIDITADTTLWGQTFRETYSYRLKTG
jgi:hypothetical protein